MKDVILSFLTIVISFIIVVLMNIASFNLQSFIKFLIPASAGLLFLKWKMKNDAASKRRNDLA